MKDKMSFFTSSTEKRFWICALIVLVTIFSTLFIGQPLAKFLANQDIQAAFFLLGMFLIGVLILFYGWSTETSKTEFIVFLGILAVYIMFFLRLGLPERSHLIEYSVLTIFIHKALTERIKQGKNINRPALIVLIAVFSIGVIDETLQLFLPNRVFDTNDIIFNGIAAFLALGANEVLKVVKKRIK